VHKQEKPKEVPNMQISRHWRIKPLRYRLEGVRYENGEVSLQTRPALPADAQRKPQPKDAQVVAVHPALGR
jgi:hypothetical protein